MRPALVSFTLRKDMHLKKLPVAFYYFIIIIIKKSSGRLVLLVLTSQY
jgi:hypothetical protein